MTRDDAKPFVGRKTLLVRLDRFYRTSRNVLIHGPAGSGKSVLMEEFAKSHALLFARGCSCLGDMVSALEPPAGLDRGELKLAARVHRLAARLPQIRRPVVIDNVARVPPRVAHLLRAIMLGQPVWLMVRSVQPMDVGHVWPFLFLFTRVDLPPFSRAETQALLSIAEFPGDRAELLASALRLHRLAAGHPGTLAALLAELRRRTYDLRTSEGLRLLALHARITWVEAQMTTPRFRPMASRAD